MGRLDRDGKRYDGRRDASRGSSTRSELLLRCYSDTARARYRRVSAPDACLVVVARGNNAISTCEAAPARLRWQRHKSAQSEHAEHASALLLAAPCAVS